MPIVNLSDIRIPPNRVRKEFPDAAREALIRSILSKGLFHPPVVDSNNELLAGERRFLALCAIAEQNLEHQCNGKTLRPGLCYVTNIRDLSPADRLEAEIEENEIRVNISWQEKAQATARLAELRNTQRAEGTLPGIEMAPVSPREIASEIRDKPVEEVTRADDRDVRADLLVAAWLQQDDDEIANAPSRKEALALIERKLNEGYRLALSKEFNLRRQDEIHHLEQIDCIEAMSRLPDATFDVIITDPPYGRDAHTWQNGGEARDTHNYLDDFHTFEKIHTAIAHEGLRITKPMAHLYLFCDHQRFEELKRMFSLAGWDVWSRPMIWYKGNHGSIAPRPEHGPRQTYETILFAIKGNKRALSLRHDVIFVPKNQHDQRAAEKPPSLFLELLSRSVLPGDEILDPCCGTGPVFPAANKLECRATGFDIDSQAIGIASQRLSNTVAFTEAVRYPDVGIERAMKGADQEAAE